MLASTNLLPPFLMKRSISFLTSQFQSANTKPHYLSGWLMNLLTTLRLLDIQAEGAVMDASPIKKLAPELRNKIYELALYHSEGFVISVSKGTPVLKNKEGQSNVLALSATCKAIREETLAFFFSLNCFRLQTFQLEKPMEVRGKADTGKAVLKKWIDDVGERNVSHVKSLEIYVGSCKSLVQTPEISTCRSILALKRALIGIKPDIRIVIGFESIHATGGPCLIDTESFDSVGSPFMPRLEAHEVLCAYLLQRHKSICQAFPLPSDIGRTKGSEFKSSSKRIGSLYDGVCRSLVEG